jgi:mutator protein MutT
MHRVEVAIAIVCRGGRILVCQRKADDPLGGYWEFPGGKREPGETLEQCLRRELREELAIEVRPVAQLEPIDHDYPHVSVRLHPFICTYESGEIQHLACQTSRWIDPSALRDHRFPPANDRLLDQALAHLTPSRAPGALATAPRPDDGPTRPH